MNYSELSGTYNDNNYKIFSIYNNESNENNERNENSKGFNFSVNSNNPIIILEEYEILNKCLENYKKQYEDLMANNIFFMNYLNHSQDSHFNIMNIMNNYSVNVNVNSNDNNDIHNDVSKIYMNYNQKIRDNYKDWLENYYTPQKNSIENNIEIINEKINDFRKLFIFIINNILKSNDMITDNKKLCPICFENEVDTCLNPCGHTLCNNCVISNRNWRTKNCYSCRSLITDYIKIYFSV